MEIERELDRLYSLPLEEFTGARNELAARLRKDGEKDAAGAVKAARKPTQPAWVVNQLARSERKLLEALIASTESLAGAGGDAARTLIADQRDALSALGRAARKLAPSASDRAVETLRAAAIDPEARELLRIGRLTKEITPSGFPTASNTVLQASAPARGKAGAGDELAERRTRREHEQQRLRELRERARALHRAASEAEREASKARDHADKLQVEAEEARDAADEAAGELERADAQSKRSVSSSRTRRR